MVAPSLRAEQTEINNVTEPRERVPIGRVKARECPPNRAPGQTGADMWVGRHISRIVEVREIVP